MCRHKNVRGDVYIFKSGVKTRGNFWTEGMVCFICAIHFVMLYRNRMLSRMEIYHKYFNSFLIK
jgi:hypothetical protein